jgi:hypothetical protein
VIDPERAVVPEASFKSRFDRPIFIVSTPRSGSTLLFETIKQAPTIHTVGGESHWFIEDIPGLAPAARGWSSNRLTALDADPEKVEALSIAFYEALRDRDGRRPAGMVRMVEKTPKNSLRVPFFAAAYPDASFVYLYRDVRQTLASMLEAWATGAFQTYPDLPGWSGRPWSLLLIPGWERLKGANLTTIVAQQWVTTTDILLNDLADLPADRVRSLDYDQFLAAPQAAMEKMCASLDLEWDRLLGSQLPLSVTTVSAPRREKWRRLEGVIDSMMAAVAEADARARDFLDRYRS